MEKRDIREKPADRVAEAVRHALRLVGPAERGLERVRETVEDRPAA